MDSNLDLTNEQKAALEKMKEIAGDLFFESWINESLEHLDVLYGLTSVLGQLYGEVIRQTRGREDLQNKVTTAFQSAMALEPNFGREEVLRDPGAEGREEGRANLEKWKEATAKEMAALEERLKAKAAMTRILDAPVGAPLPKDSPFATIDWDKDDEVQAKAEAAKPKAVCFKCKNTGNMGFSTYMRCDAC